MQLKCEACRGNSGLSRVSNRAFFWEHFGGFHSLREEGNMCVETSRTVSGKSAGRSNEENALGRRQEELSKDLAKQE